MRSLDGAAAGGVLARAAGAAVGAGASSFFSGAASTLMFSTTGGLVFGGALASNFLLKLSYDQFGGGSSLVAGLAGTGSATGSGSLIAVSVFVSLDMVLSFAEPSLAVGSAFISSTLVTG